MAVNKNFVVKNGIEVADNLVFASSDLEKVGIGSTVPTDTLMLEAVLLSLTFMPRVLLRVLIISMWEHQEQYLLL